MKTILALAVVALWAAAPAVHSQTPPDSSNTNSTAGLETNTVPLKYLMTTNNIATNTVGVVLVKITPDFWVGRFEVTQKSYQKVIGANPSAFVGGNHPVDSVSWNDAMAFCSKLTEKERDQLPGGFAYSLPTEAQWEQLVANASLNDAVMAYSGTSHGSTAPVGSLGPNSLGLYDMRGNVMEWCLNSQDPTRYHVLRGGAWDTWVEPSTRVQFRNYAGPGDKKNDYGFRVVLEPGEGAQ
ncbi:MAG: SUMF1/EgtB/PvdO family nonheme iron enzyme [Verrucomicrobiota bacterium]|nr:SUMF1/EgtB/PvdO family nonheme iron enzyme [Verrucomicrobiota bacterium]